MGIALSHTGTERVEHTQIIITSAQKSDNVIPTLDRSLSMIRIRVIKTDRNIWISLSL